MCKNEICLNVRCTLTIIMVRSPKYWCIPFLHISLVSVLLKPPMSFNHLCRRECFYYLFLFYEFVSILDLKKKLKLKCNLKAIFTTTITHHSKERGLEAKMDAAFPLADKEHWLRIQWPVQNVI